MKKEDERQKAAVESNKQTEDQTRVVPPLTKFVPTEHKPVYKPAKTKKKSKLGPTTSAYFAKPEVPDPKSKREPIAGASRLMDAAKSSDTNKRPKKQQRAAARMGAELEASHRANVSTKVEEPTELAVEDGAMDMEPSAVEPASQVQEIEPVLANLDDIESPGEYEIEVKDKKRKRKKKRNHNRLPKEQAAGVKNQTETGFANPKASYTSQEPVNLHAEKRSHTKAFIENLPDAQNDEVPVSDVHENDGKDIEDQPKPKKYRRRKRREGEEPIVLDQSQHSMPNHDTEIPMVPDDQDAEHEKQQANTLPIQEHKDIRPSKKQRRDRGRKSKGKQKEDINETAEEKIAIEPLTELANTNTKQPKEGRRDRGRGRRRESDEHSKLEVDCPSSTEQSKVHHS
jgi:hypothetical protein